MPRDVGTGLYHYPEGTLGNPGQTVFSARYNTFLNDLAFTMNEKLPINMGGTGSDNAAEARSNIDAEVAGVTVTNYDTHVWESGSFWSGGGATGAPPVAGGYAGTCIILNNDPNHIVLEARAENDTLVPGRKYVREKKSGVWGAWVDDANSQLDGKVNVTGDTMSGPLTVTPKGSIFGTAGGAAGSGSVSSSDANIRLYEFGVGNWCGMGADGGGAFWLRTGNSGTAAPALFIAPDRNATFTGTVTIHGNVATNAISCGTLNTNANTLTAGPVFCNAITCGTIQTNNNAISCGSITSSSNITASGGVQAAVVLATGSNGLQCSVPAGNHARMWLTVAGARLWSAGVISDGTFAINDETGGANRLLIDLAGNTKLTGQGIATKWHTTTNSGFTTTTPLNASFWTTGSYGGGVIMQDGATVGGIYLSGQGGGSLWLGCGGGGNMATGNARVQGDGSFIISGQGWKTGGGSWADSSDARIKNIVGDYQNGLDAVLSLHPVKYTFKGNDQLAPIADPKATKVPRETVVPYSDSPHFTAAKDTKEFIGLIAQECEAAFPEMVKQHAGMIDGRPVTDMRALDTSPLIFALVNAVKTLAARIETLEAAQTTP